MYFNRLHNKQKYSTYSSNDDEYILEGTPGKWYSFYTPGGSAARLGQPSKKFDTARYLCEYHKIIYNSPDAE